MLAEGGDLPFVLLLVNVPDGLELDLGCDPCSRFLGFFPDPFGDHLVFDNGSAEAALDERAWAAWLGEPPVQGCVAQAMRDEAWSFLLDTCTRRLYTGSEQATRAFLYCHRLARNSRPDR